MSRLAPLAPMSRLCHQFREDHFRKANLGSDTRKGQPMTSAFRSCSSTMRLLGCAALLTFGLLGPQGAISQQLPQGGGWGAGLSIDPEPAEGPANTTVIKRTFSDTPGSAKAPAGMARIRLVAMLTADGQYIDRGVVWRIFTDPGNHEVAPTLLETHDKASPTLELKPGNYIVNAAFGRAHLTRRLSIPAGDAGTEKFVINAGGLRVQALVSNRNVAANTVYFDIYDGERNQLGERNLVMSSAKPGVIIRLNAGIYHIVSTYGDSNAKVATDVTVEAGKLTEATLTHAAAKVTLRLVNRPGGDAQPSTQWTIETLDGELVKRSIGALPTHILAPGTYKVTATHSGRAYEQEFQVEDGKMARVEVVMQ